MADRLLDGQRVVVTGANRGIGWATCEVLAANGAHLIAATRAADAEFMVRLSDLGRDHDVEVDRIPLELSDDGSQRDFLSALRKAPSPVTGLVNNAGVTWNSLFQLSSLAATRELFDVNFFGAMSLMQGCSRLMARQRQGSIVNVSSTAAIDANPGRSVYGASKAALSTLTRGAARELAPLGIRVNAVAPGVTETEMRDTMSAEVLAEVEGATDMGRSGQPVEIAEAICFLLSPLAAYVTGQVLRVDGGMRA